VLAGVNTLPHWYHASVRHFTHRVLKLNGGVMDAEIVMEPFFDIAQDALTD